MGQLSLGAVRVGGLGALPLKGASLDAFLCPRTWRLVSWFVLALDVLGSAGGSQPAVSSGKGQKGQLRRAHPGHRSLWSGLRPLPRLCGFC